MHEVMMIGVQKHDEALIHAGFWCVKFECKFKNDIKLGDYYIYGRIFAVNVEIGIRFRNIQLTKGKNYDSRKRVCGLEIGVPARGCDEDCVSISGTLCRRISGRNSRMPCWRKRCVKSHTARPAI